MREKIVKVSETYGGELMSAADLADDAEIVVTIGHVSEFKDKEKGSKIRLAFCDYEKDMVLNKTNAAFVAAKLGDDTDLWIGGRLKLAAKEVLYMGKPTMGMAVTAVSKKGAKPTQPKPSPENDIPF